MWPIKICDKGRYRRFLWSNDGIWFHLGHDFDVPGNTMVFAVDEGEVIFSGIMKGFGGANPPRDGGCIIIQHKGYICIYGHLKNMISIKKVEKGELIGNVAQYYLGDTRCDHLHFGKHLGQGIPIVDRNGKKEPSYLGYELAKNLTGWVDPLGDGK